MKGRSSKWTARAAGLVGLLIALCLPAFSQSNITTPIPVEVFKTIAATGTQTSALLSNPLYDQFGTLIITWASITGSPLTCTFQVKSADSQGNLINNGSTISVTPANGTTSQTFTPAATLLGAPQSEIVFACGTYPTGGTLTVDFVPAEVIYVGGSALANQTVNQTQLGGIAVAPGSTTTSNSFPVVNATNQGNPCVNPNSTPTSVFGATSGTALTQIVALSAGKQIFICNATFTSVSGTTPTYGLEYGTGTNCGSGTTVIVGSPSATTVAGTVVNFPGNPWILPASNALCYKMGTTTPVFNYAITYVQQ